MVLDEVAREFDGEDPLRPIMRGIVEKTRQKLIDLHAVFGRGAEGAGRGADGAGDDLLRQRQALMEGI